MELRLQAFLELEYFQQDVILIANAFGPHIN